MQFTNRAFIVFPILWLGFVLAISFMEAWLKFQADGVTQSIGLSVGKLVFSALNKVELFFLVCLVLIAIFNLWGILDKIQKLVLIGLTILLFIQTFYLLPILDARADLIRSGIVPKKSHMHLYYVILEVIKVIMLVVFSHNSLQRIHTFIADGQ